MKTRTIFLAIALLSILAACTPMPELDGMLASARDNAADPGGTAYAPSWKVLGSSAISSGTASFVTMAMDGAVPYVAFAQGTSIKVKKYSSGAWVDQPSNAATATVTGLAFTVAAATPYIAFTQTGLTPSCRYLASGSWADLGTISGIGLTVLFKNPSLAVAGSNVFVVGNDTLIGYVAAYNGSGWAKYDFSGVVDPSAISLALKNGLPSMSFLNTPASVAVSVKEPADWPPTTWSYFLDGASPTISGANMEETSLIVVSGVPYVAYMITGSVTVRKYSAANTWTAVGSASFVNGGHNIKLAANAAGEVYIAFKDTSNASKITVMKFNGTTWVNVGTPGFSGAVGSYLDFAISQTDGTLYVAYQNASDTNQAQVMAFN